MKLELETSFTPYTLDTYQTFTFDNVYSQVCEDLACGFDDLEWDCEHNHYVQALAENWVVLMNENIVDDVILGVKAEGKSYSPREYNFRTDGCNMFFDVNVKELEKYIEKNLENYNENKLKSCDGFMWFGDDLQTKLNFYLENETTKKYEAPTYYFDQIDGVDANEYVSWEKIK